jgi:YggT family protein
VITGLISLLIEIISWIIIIDVILSWVLAVQRPRWADNAIVRLIQEVSYQILRPFRKLLDRTGLRTGPIDFSPLIAIMALRLIGWVLIGVLNSIGIR